jgi:integrase
MAKKRTVTKSSVDALNCPPGKDRVFLWDNNPVGFGVAAMASGSKIYVIQYRQNGRSRRMKIGRHGKLTPDQARSEAIMLLGSVERGEDPIAAKKKAKQARTFKDVAADYMANHADPKRKERTSKEYHRILKLWLLPAFGASRLVEITRTDVSRFHAKHSERPGAANRALALFSAIWNWAAVRGEATKENNPASGLERYAEHERDRFLTQDELRRLGAALNKAETLGLPWDIDETRPTAKHLPKKKRTTTVDPYAVAAIRLLIFTGARLREILHARWDHIDWDHSILRLPDSKTGKKPIYLSAAALGILANIEPRGSNPFIIPGEKKNAPRADLKKPWAAIARAAGLVEYVQDGDKLTRARTSVRLHDLRHTFASTGVGASIGLPVVGKLLGHSQAATTQRYAHIAADPLHKAVNLIGSQISKALTPPPTEKDT